uniref:Uncharacterized protein n=1 Tax=Tenebrio molitor TaxID=7067 RepID=A0A8J6H450_TENMO|nr:hypothetical protein GEV33_014999 [Tenebrio molitor]
MTVIIVATMKALFPIAVLFFVFSLIGAEDHAREKRSVIRDFVENVADIFVPTDPPPPVVFNTQAPAPAPVPAYPPSYYQQPQYGQYGAYGQYGQYPYRY